MTLRRLQRLNESYTILWEYDGIGASVPEIASRLGLKSISYVRGLLEELIQNGQATKKLNINFDSRRLMKYYAVHTSIRQVANVGATTPLYDPIATWTFDNDHCFLCGTELDESNRTDEHIFPKWLQGKYNLWNGKFGLLNGTVIKYSQLVIPCCATCNGIFLSNVEKYVQAAHDEGIDGFRSLPRIVLYQWLAKIFYGILFKELSLLANRADPSLGSIFSEEELRQYAMLHYFLQSVRLPFVFHGFQPWSIFVVKAMVFGDSRDFDYVDSSQNLVFSIRIGEVGIIACLEDGGLQEEVDADYFEDVNQLAVHPVQFRELVARVTYGSLLMNRTPKYFLKLPDQPTTPTEVNMLPLMGLSNKPLFDEYDPKTYATILYQYWNEFEIDFQAVYEEPGLVRTAIFNEEGKLIQLDAEGKLMKVLESKSNPQDEPKDE